MAATTLSQSPSARIAHRLAEAVGQRKYEMWFDQSAHLDYHEEDRTLAVAVPNRFVAERIGRDFSTQLRSAAADELGDDVEIDVRIDPDRFNLPAPSRPEPVSEQTRQRLRMGSTPETAPADADRANAYNLRHSLDQFIVGPSNELAYRAAAGIAQDSTVANTVFLHGGCGLGKTHLLQGACRALLDRNPAARVQYVTGEQFTNEYITAIRTNSLDAFRKKIRRLDLLAVDDVHFLANKDKTQQEFLHCYDAIDLAGARVILASDCHPKQIKKFSEALISRCVRGLVVQVHQPDVQTRKALINALAERRGLVLLEEAVDYLVARMTGSVREIEGTLTKLHALASLTRNPNTSRSDVGPRHHTQPIGLTLLHRLFADPALASQRKPVRFEAILETVCQKLGVTAARITGSSRHKQVVLGRSLVIHLTHQLTGMSYPEIANAFGKANHSTMVTANKRIKELLAQEPQPLLIEGREITLRALLDELRSELARA